MSGFFGTPQRDWELVDATDESDPLSDAEAYALLLWSGSPLKPSYQPTTIGQAVIPLVPSDPDEVAPNGIILAPFGKGDNNAQGQMRIWGFSKTPIDNSGNYAYKAVYLGTLHLSLGEADASLIVADFAFVDNIAVAEDASPTPPGMKVYGDVNNGMAEVSIDTYGCQFIVIEYTVKQFNTQGGSPPPEMDELGFFYRTI